EVAMRHQEAFSCGHFICEPGHYNARGGRRTGGNFGEEFDAQHVWHCEVRDDYVEGLLVHPVQRLLTAGCSYYGVVLSEKRGKQLVDLKDRRFIINKQDAFGHRLDLAGRATSRPRSSRRTG